MRSLIVVLSVAAVQASTISVTDLGTLGGSSAAAFGINASGMAVGWAETSTGDQQAFSSANGGWLNLPSLSGASDSAAYGVNASGVIVGTSSINGQTHGEIWNGATATDLGAGIFATGINDPGAIVGGNGHAFLLVDGAYRDLGTLPGGDWSAAYAVNNAGEAAGYGNIAPGVFRAFLWTSSGGLTELGTFGGRNSYAAGINNSGEAVGNAGLANGYEHAFLAVGAVMTDLGTLGGESSYAYGINDNGSVVGYSSLPDGQTQAFVYVNGVMMNLNALIPSGSGWQLLEAYGINDAGQIVGEGFFNGQAQAFRLDPEIGFSARALTIQPAPDPGTMSLTGIGLVLTGAFFKRRRRVISS